MTASTGTDSANALCIAITRLAAPGPREAMQTRGAAGAAREAVGEETCHLLVAG